MAGDQNLFEKDNVDINHRQPFLGQGCFRPKGSFNNYVDQNLTNFDPLPPSSGQAWTFTYPPCPRGQKVEKKPPLKYQHVPHFNQHITWANMTHF